MGNLQGNLSRNLKVNLVLCMVVIFFNVSLVVLAGVTKTLLGNHPGASTLIILRMDRGSFRSF